jgi:hypothetical protein
MRTAMRSLLGISCALVLGCGVKPLEVIMETDAGTGGSTSGAGQGGGSAGSGGAQGGSGGGGSGGSIGGSGGSAGSGGGSGGSAGGGGGSSGGGGGSSGGSGGSSGGSGGSIGGSGGSTGGSGGGAGGTGGTYEVGVGESCGGFRPAPVPICKPALFCELPAGGCRIADASGKCVATNQPCDLILAPVCGCDGKTYSNDCARRNARVQLDHVGGCKSNVGAMCGGIAGFKCDPGLFCDPSPGTCKVADAGGTCQAVPQGCPKILQPVCGCDGNTYANDCIRQMAQVALSHEGACKGPMRLQAGQWGTTSPPAANLLVKDPMSGGSLEFDCADGLIQGPLDVGGDGAFKWKGTWTFRGGGPQPIPPPLPVVRDVIYTGKLSGDTLVLNVVFANGGMMQGPYIFTFGKVALLHPCL